VPTPAGLSQTDAAAMPLVFMTAYHALHELARLKAGERVLIHAAAGGVGLAALQLALRAGATVFATAGSPAKRDFLRSLGIQHVYDSRSLDFADQIRADTAGAGVDVVLNSLSGPAIPRSLDLLAPRGRFLEIGKRDIYADSHIGLAPFRKNLSFFAIDLARWTEEDPAGVVELFQTVMGLAAAGEVKPLPSRIYPIGQVADAFRIMAQARHIGKVVVAVGDEPARLAHDRVSIVRADATYLITGGLGGLGLETAEWLAARGARHIALLGRRAPSSAARQAITRIEAGGARVLVLAADVADSAQLAEAMEAVRTTLPPLCGVIHAAGVLADATLAQMDRERLLDALAPKVRGAWNLHALTREMPLDFFVFFSSVAALFGLPGQANYAAGNAFLDALAHQRHASGLPALSVNWGPWAEVGLAAAERNRGERLADRGLGSLSRSEGLAALEALLRAGTTQATVMRFDPRRWATASRSVATSLLAGLGAAPAALAGQDASLRAAVLAAEPGKARRSVLESFLREQLARVLQTVPDRIEGHKPLKAMGLDSLMALELRNLLEAGSGLSLSATLAWNYPTVGALAGHLADLLAVPLDGHANGSAQAEADPESPLANASPDTSMDASADDIEAVLNAELAAAERLLGRR
jgi:NADPH:quinone reductase-like Zn-dependent oxidoreductase/acyl carrier protein